SVGVRRRGGRGPNPGADSSAPPPRNRGGSWKRGWLMKGLGGRSAATRTSRPSSSSSPESNPEDTVSTSPVVDAPLERERIAAGILRGAEYDFGSLQASPALVLDRPARRGVRVMAAQTSRLPHDVVDALLGWRLGQYVLTGFSDTEIVTELGMSTV